ncbi:endolytic transglycosylase MltG [Thalassotalea maritima]|uniref:endolytic transglycosylase MltG n=1 Tax=Thalassotalea maritima TaxID=3242416 RepID=UPI003529C48D
MYLRFAFAVVFMLITVVGAITYIYVQMNTHMLRTLPIQGEELYSLSSGKSYNYLLNDFKVKGYIDSTFYYRLYGKLNPEQTRLKSGAYRLSEGMTMLDVLQVLLSGKEAQFKITFIEGTTFKDWLHLLSERQHIKQTLEGLDEKQVLAQITSKFDHPEGLFFPDTYVYTVGSKDIDILQQAYQRMERELARSWQTRSEKLPYKSSYEALIMASLIEKETGKLAEQPLIASVFISRLRKGMRLQTDPTIIYGLGDRYTGDITYANIREKTAYNTYQIDGLPPTPIAMPGKSAIEASMHPANSDYLYFVSKGNGEHYFSTSLQEHNRAVNKYIRGKE